MGNLLALLWGSGDVARPWSDRWHLQISCPGKSFPFFGVLTPVTDTSPTVLPAEDASLPRLPSLYRKDVKLGYFDFLVLVLLYVAPFNLLILSTLRRITSLGHPKGEDKPLRITTLLILKHGGSAAWTGVEPHGNDPGWLQLLLL